jgi:hypothetical protein
MKNHSNTLFSRLLKEDIHELTGIVSETLADDFSGHKTRQFAVADLWDIQRRVKYRIQRRYSF